MTSTTYTIDHDAKQINACCYCFPGNKVFAAFPELASLSYYGVSHGICAPCLAKQKAILAEKRAVLEFRGKRLWRIKFIKSLLVNVGIVKG